MSEISWCYDACHDATNQAQVYLKYKYWRPSANYNTATTFINIDKQTEMIDCTIETCASSQTSSHVYC